eukprot:scaffold412113_cov85-Attheya_sp.AAC.1
MSAPSRECILYSPDILETENALLNWILISSKEEDYMSSRPHSEITGKWMTYFFGTWDKAAKPK